MSGPPRLCTPTRTFASPLPRPPDQAPTHLAGWPHHSVQCVLDCNPELCPLKIGLSRHRVHDTAADHAKQRPRAGCDGLRARVSRRESGHRAVSERGHIRLADDSRNASAFPRRLDVGPGTTLVSVAEHPHRTAANSRAQGEARGVPPGFERDIGKFKIVQFRWTD